MASAELEKKEKVCVIVRVRPMIKDEATTRSPWKLSSKSIASNKTCRPSVPSHSYTFDRIYGAKTPTLDIYNAHVKDIIKSTMAGINGTVIAYGQSDSGKSFTLRGSSEEAGILMLALQDMLQTAQEASDREYLIRMSYLEVANELLNDLLASRAHKIDIREDAELGVVISGLREEIVIKSEQVSALLEFAEGRRSVEARNASNGGEAHSIVRLVIESTSLDKQNDQFDVHAKDRCLISSLNLVEVSLPKAHAAGSQSSQEGKQPEKSLITLQSVKGDLTERAEKAEGSVPYAASRLTHILRPSLGGNSRTCFICNVSPALVHMDATIASLEFASKTNNVMNCFQVNEVWTDKALLKRQRREIFELRSKLKEIHVLDLEEEILNRRNALLMIEQERGQMSLELFEKTPSSSQGENKEQDQDQRGENITFEGESGFDKCFDLGDFNDPLQKRNFTDCLGYFNPAQGLQELDLDLQMNYTGLCLGPSVGSKRKRRSNTTTVVVDKHLEQELLADEQCRTFQRNIADLEAEKAMMERRLHEQEITHSKAMEALKHELAQEKSIQKKVEVGTMFTYNTQKSFLDGSNSHTSNGLNDEQENLAERQHHPDDNGVKQNTEAQSCTSQEIEYQQRVSKGKEDQTTPTKKKPSKANKVFQKFQSFQGRSELSSVRRELAVAKETITALEDERNGLWKDLNQMKTKCKEVQSRPEIKTFEEDSKGEHKFHQPLAAALDTLKTEVESTASITDDLRALLSESFQILAADLKSFQEGVAELKVLNGATADISESLEYAKIQLVALRQGKITSDKELYSMKSELAKLECVVERQSGVLKVLSDNENLLNELASVRAAMKEAAGASELQMSSIQQEHDTRVKELESDYRHWRQEYLQLEEEQTKLQDKLCTTEAEVLRLTQALEEKTKLDKRPAKNIKARLASAEAEIMILATQLKEKAVSEEGPRKLQIELADCKSEVENLKKEIEDKNQLVKEHGEALTKLANLEAMVVKLTAACEEHMTLEREQKNLQLKLESEIANLSKLLEEKSGMEAQQKNIQIDLTKLQEKFDGLTREVEQKDVLEKKHCETIVRLDNSDKEVIRLKELLQEQKEQYEVYSRELLERIRAWEAKVVGWTESLQREMEEKDRLLEVNRKYVADKENAEADSGRLVETVKRIQQEKEIEEEKHRTAIDIIATREVEIKKLTESLKSVTDDKKILNKEKMKGDDARVSTEAEVKRLTESLHQESATREKLDKELRQTLDKFVSLEADIRILTQSHHKVKEAKEQLENDNRQALEAISSSKVNLRKVSESLQQELQEKESMERELKRGFDELANTDSKVLRIIGNWEREAQKRSLNEDHKDAIDDRTDSIQQVNRLIRDLFEELKEQKVLGSRLEDITEKLAATETEVVSVTQTLNSTSQEKEVLEKGHAEMRQICACLKEEVGRLTERLAREIKSRAKLVKDSQTGVEESASFKTEPNKLTTSAKRVEKKRRVKLDNAKSPARTASLQDEIAKLRETLAKELETREKLERDHVDILDQLLVSKIEASRLSANLTKEAEESKSLMTDHCHTLSRLASSNSEIANLSGMLEEKPQLEEELQNLQLILAGSEAEIVRLNEELVVKGRWEDEHTRIQCQLVRVEEEVAVLRDEKVRLGRELNEALIRCTITEAEVLKFREDGKERTKLAEELQLLHTELSDSKADLATVRATLGAKLGVEEAHIRTQMELVNKQGECEKLVKELRINRKMVKEQKKLLRKLTSTQSEVVTLRSVLAIKSEEHLSKTNREHEIDATVAGVASARNEKSEVDGEHKGMLERLASSEAEVKRLSSVLEQKIKLEEECANIQHELARAETEIQRLNAALEENSKLNEQRNDVHLKMVDGAMSTSLIGNSGLEVQPGEFLIELIERGRKLEEREMELQSKLAAHGDKKRAVLVPQENTLEKDYKCAECEILRIFVEQLKKERDELTERCTAAHSKLHYLHVDFDKQKKELENAEKTWKTNCQKSEKEVADLRSKLTKVEEGAAWIVREKKLLEERLSCSEAQIATLREAARTTTKELEMARHHLHLLTSQHQADVAAFCGELSLKTARNTELEKELKSFLTHPRPAPVISSEYVNYVTAGFRQQPWSYAPPLQPPQQPGQHHDPHWSDGSNQGPQR